MNDLRKQDEDSESEDNEGLEGVRRKKRVVADIDSDEDGDQDQVAVHGEDNRSEDDEILSQGDENIDALQLDCEKGTSNISNIHIMLTRFLIVSDVGSDEEPDGLFGKDMLAEADEKVRQIKQNNFDYANIANSSLSKKTMYILRSGHDCRTPRRIRQTSVRGPCAWQRQVGRLYEYS